MLTINYKQIYETNEKVDKEWVLIIYDISANHSSILFVNP